MSRIGWASRPQRLLRGTGRGVRRAVYDLNSLVEARLIGPRKARRFREVTRLADFTWEATWSIRAGRQPGEALSRAEGCVVLIHGWDGSRAIWEDLPTRICLGNPRLFVLAPDVNGFGGSPFAEDLPPLNGCDPAAVMQAVESWVDLLNLRSGPRAHRRYRVLTFVGHSRGAQRRSIWMRPAGGPTRSPAWPSLQRFSSTTSCERSSTRPWAWGSGLAR